MNELTLTEGDTRLMSARDIQTELGVKENRAWWIIRHCGRVVKLGRSTYVYREDVDRVLSETTREVV